LARVNFIILFVIPDLIGNPVFCSWIPARPMQGITEAGALIKAILPSN